METDMKQKHSKKQLTNTLNQISCALTHRLEVDALMEQTAGFPCSHLNRELNLVGHQFYDSLRFALTWNPPIDRAPGMYVLMETYWDLPVRCNGRWINVSLFDIQSFLNELRKEASRYVGRHNPVKQLARMTDESGYVVATNGAPVLNKVAEEWQIILPRGMNAPAMIAYPCRNEEFCRRA